MFDLGPIVGAFIDQTMDRVKSGEIPFLPPLDELPHDVIINLAYHVFVGGYKVNFFIRDGYYDFELTPPELTLEDQTHDLSSAAIPQDR